MILDLKANRLPWLTVNSPINAPTPIKAPPVFFLTLSGSIFTFLPISHLIIIRSPLPLWLQTHRQLSRTTNRHLCFKWFSDPSLTVRGWTDGWTERQTLPSTLSPFFAMLHSRKKFHLQRLQNMIWHTNCQSSGPSCKGGLFKVCAGFVVSWSRSARCSD